MILILANPFPTLMEKKTLPAWLYCGMAIAGLVVEVKPQEGS